MKPSVFTPVFFMCATTAFAITPLDWGRRKVQVSLPGGSGAGDIARWSVLLSAATSAMGMATGVAPEPASTSTLSSVTKRRAFCTPLVGSVASSRMMTFTFSPAIVCGHSLKPFCIGMPRPDAGPVSGRLTPTVMSASAPALISAAASATTVGFRVRGFMCEGLLRVACSKLFQDAQRLRAPCPPCRHAWRGNRARAASRRRRPARWPTSATRRTGRRTRTCPQCAAAPA